MNDKTHDETGGPAFPLDDGVHRGMTLRDHFAGLAMFAILGNQNSRSSAPDFVSEWAYKHADSMLKAREQ